MAKATFKCRVCGSEYEACHTPNTGSGVFRWQDVACCPEHGAIYLQQVLESRAQEGTGKTPVSLEADNIVEESTTVKSVASKKSTKKNKKTDSTVFIPEDVEMVDITEDVDELDEEELME